jgi:hypothetical protein
MTDTRAALSIALLAMAPSGETYMARDPFGRVWLLQPPGAGEPLVIDASVVDAAVGKHGFERVDREFTSWAELDRFRLEMASLTTRLPAAEARPLDLEDVARLFGVVRRWAAGGETSRARQASFALLEEPVVLGDPAVHHRILLFLKDLGEPRSLLAPDPGSDDKAKYHDRWRIAA